MALKEAPAPSPAMRDPEALQPVLEGLEETLRTLSIDDRAYFQLRDLHRVLARRGVVTAATDAPPRDAVSFAEAIQPALEGMRLTLRHLEQGHWAWLVVKSHYSHMWWATQRPDALRPGPRPPLVGPPA